ncbi:ankyrin repeat domain-containing protein [Aurantimonas sp. A2-1-M11]|uniref:ankyrin repeat domain-containing protein n=1 Tax=Aurantimonas sp. A2-1-M11 TaxID=3113712 RepID=UPI002F92CCC6
MQAIEETTMQDEANGPAPEFDEETLALAAMVFEAARRGDAVAMADFLDKGLPPNLRNDKGDSLLMLASYHGHVELTQLLLTRGADPSLTNDRGQTPLAGAAFKGETGIAQLLLDHGASVDGTGPDGRTPLMMAAMFNRTAMVETFLARGADLNARAVDGMDALGAAKAMGAQDTAAQIARLKAEATG